MPLKTCNELGVKPGDRIVFEKEGDKVVVRPVRKKSPFEKYRGIGSAGIGSGREPIIRHIRKIRGFDPDDK